MKIIWLDGLARRLSSLSEDQRVRAISHLLQLSKAGALPPKTGKPQRGRPNRRQQQLRLASLIFADKLKVGGTYHWKPEATIRSHLRENYDLAPNSKGEPWRAADSEYRKLDSEWRKQHERWQATHESDFHTLFDSLDGDTQELLFSLMCLLRHCLEGKEGAELATAFWSWLALCHTSLPASLFEQLQTIFVPPRERDLLVGAHLQVEAERERMQARKPFHPHSSVCDI